MSKWFIVLFTHSMLSLAGGSAITTRSATSTTAPNSPENLQSLPPESAPFSANIAITQCSDIRDPGFLKIKKLLKHGNLQSLIKYLQVNDLSRADWASCMYVAAIEEDNINAFSYLIAYDVATMAPDFHLKEEIMKWCCEHSRWDYLSHFVFIEKGSRLPLFSLFKAVVEDDSVSFLRLLKEKEFSKQDLDYAFKFAIWRGTGKVLNAVLDTDSIYADFAQELLVEYIFASPKAFKSLSKAGVSLTELKPNFLNFLLHRAVASKFSALTVEIMNISNWLFRLRVHH